MTRAPRTNPAYSYLAYRRAVIQHVVHLLVRDYTAPTGQEPAQHIYSDEVMRGDAEVPVNDIIRYIEELQQIDAELLLEMNKFEFRKVEEPKPTPTEPPKLSKDQPDESKEPQVGTGAAAAPKKPPTN
jgi:hypothetical protein